LLYKLISILKNTISISIAFTLLFTILFLFANISLFSAYAQTNQTYSNNSVNTLWTNYKSPNFGISVNFPKAWLYDDKLYNPENGSPSRIIDIISPEQYGKNNVTAHTSIWAQNLTIKGVSPELYTQRQVSDAKLSSPDFTLIELNPTTIDTNIPAYSIIYTYKENPGNHIIKVMKTVTVSKGDIGYSIIYAADQELFSKYKPVADIILKSFNFANSTVTNISR
jgi:hypothetical protein